MWKYLLAVTLFFGGCGKEESAPSLSNDRAKDPVCKMMVDKTTPYQSTFDNATYYFCAETCLKKFQADPKPYVAACACSKRSEKCACDHCGRPKPS